ncbi:MAG: ParB N-terminal domain-containing protein [Acidimicrobiales bacterium]
MAAGDKGPRPPNGQTRTGVHLLRVADLSVGYSPRQPTVDDDHVTLLGEVIDRLPPIVVDERTMTVIDGVHRLEAARRAGRAEIRALLFSGDGTEALVIAIQANVRHGKPLSRAERQAAACALLRRSPDRSDRWVGEICGLSHSTVARLRQAAEIADRDVRTGRDGRRRPVDPSPGHTAVAKALGAGPATSIRQAAEIAGVAASTAQRVAAGLRERPKSSPGGALPLAPGPAPGPQEPGEDPVPRSSPGRAETASWLERTAVGPKDFGTYLEDIPLGRVYEVADECRQRARTWSEMADALEKLARARRGLRLE